MSYTDARYQQVVEKVTIPCSGTATQSAVASAGVGTLAGLSGMYYQAQRAMTLKSGALTCFAAPVSTYNPITVALMNGTTTVATAAVTTATVNQAFALTVTAANAALASGGTFTFNAITTCTASNAGASTGGFTAYLEFNDTFS